MKFQNANQFKRYLTRLIKEEKEAMDADEVLSYMDNAPDMDDMEDMDDDEMMMSDLEKGSSGGYGAGYGYREKEVEEEEEVVEEAYIPFSYFRKSMIAESARKNNKSANTIAKAFTAFESGMISESRAIRSICSVTKTLPSNTYVKKGDKSVSLRRFLRANR